MHVYKYSYMYSYMYLYVYLYIYSYRYLCKYLYMYLYKFVSVCISVGPLYVCAVISISPVSKVCICLHRLTGCLERLKGGRHGEGKNSGWKKCLCSFPISSGWEYHGKIRRKRFPKVMYELKSINCKNARI